MGRCIAVGPDPTPWLRLIDRNHRVVRGFFLRNQDRLIWGGAFPVRGDLGLAAERLQVDIELYESQAVIWRGDSHRGLALTPEATRKLFRDNAVAVYGL